MISEEAVLAYTIIRVSRASNSGSHLNDKYVRSKLQQLIKQLHG